MPIKKTGYTISTHSIKSYTLSKWIVIQPGNPSINTAGVSTSFSIGSWKNMPYAITGGVLFKGYVWVDGNIMQEFTFNPQIPAVPNTITTSAFIGSSQFTNTYSKYEVTF